MNEADRRAMEERREHIRRFIPKEPTQSVTQGANHIAVYCKDQDETARFYTEVKIGQVRIGVRISRGVTMHGFALNVDPDLSYFDHIVPCGVRDADVTSMAMVLSRHQKVGAVASVLQETFGRAFGLSMELRHPTHVETS